MYVVNATQRDSGLAKDGAYNYLFICGTIHTIHIKTQNYIFKTD